MAKKSVNLRIGWDMKAFSTSSQNLSRSLKKTGGKMKSIGKSMSMSLTAPIVGLGGLAVKTFADFQQSMAKVQAISGATGDDFEALTKTAKDLGISTRFAASEVSELMLNYSKLGFSSDEIQKITGATLDLALATGEDLAQSASVAGGTLRGFGLEAGEMTRVTDVMARAFSGSALDLQKFQNSMPKVSAVASSLGITLEETTSMLGVLVGKNIQATTAGTGLKNIFLMTRKSGMSFKDAMDKINNSIDPPTTALNMFGKENATVAVALAQSGDAITEMNAKLSDTSVTASSMAKIMDDTLEGSMMRLKSATEGLGISFGEVMAPAVGAAANFISEIAMKFSNLSEGTKKTIVVIAALAAAIGPLIFAVGGLTTAFAFLAANPIILIITGIIVAIGGLVAAFIYVKNNAQAFADFFYNIWVKIANGFIDRVKVMASAALKLAGMVGLDIGGGINDWLDSFKLKARESTKDFKSLKETVKDVKKEFSQSIPTPGLDTPTPIPTPDPDPDDEKDLTDKQQKKRIGKLKRELYQIQSGIKKISTTPILPVVDVEGITTSLEKMGQEGVHIFEQMGREMGAALTTGLKDLATEGLVSFGQFLGDVMSGGDMTIQDFGRGLLDSIGKFMGQFGEAMIAMGIAQTLLDASIKTGNGPAAIIGGIALVAAGAALSNLSKKGVDKGGGVTDTGGGGGGVNFNNQNGSPGYMMQLETKVSGRDIILVQERERAFKR